MNVFHARQHCSTISLKSLKQQLARQCWRSHCHTCSMGSIQENREAISVSRDDQTQLQRLVYANPHHQGSLAHNDHWPWLLIFASNAASSHLETKYQRDQKDIDGGVCRSSYFAVFLKVSCASADCWGCIERLVIQLKPSLCNNQ